MRHSILLTVPDEDLSSLHLGAGPVMERTIPVPIAVLRAPSFPFVLKGKDSSSY